MHKKSCGNSFKNRKWTWLARTNCIFIWLEARDEGGMRGPSSLNLPTLLGRPVWRAYLPSDHIGLKGKRLQLQPRSPLGRSLQTRLSFELGLSQFSIPRLTLHQMSEGGHWDTDMCVDLACCFDTLETWSYYYVLLLHTHVPIVYYHNHYNTDYAWYSVQI